jgi:hypothetical protein
MRTTDHRYPKSLGDPNSMKLPGFGALSLRAALLGAAVCVALAAHVGPALAGDDDDDEPSVEQKIIRGLMHGLGAVDGTEKGIDYRERSPLVVPPKLNLPPPETSANAKPPQPNWPKDPELEERRKARLAVKNRDKSKEWGQILTPEEMKVGTARAKSATSSPQPGENPFSAGAGEGTVLTPSQLGFKGFGNIFGGDKPEAAPFPGEPPRESLTQPPSGYQTPSPSYAYGLNSDDQKNTFVPNRRDDDIYSTSGQK